MAGTKVGRIVRTRKDKSEITFTDYRGEEKTSKYAPVGTIWAQRRDDGSYMLSFSPDKKDEKHFFNIYFEDGISLDMSASEGDDEERREPAKKASKPAGKKPSSREEDSGEGSPF